LQPKLRILIAENAAREVSSVLEALYQQPEATLEVSSAATVAALLATIPKFSPDLLLLDLSVARPSSASTVKRIRRAAPNLPLIVVADPAEKQEGMQCLLEGAMDCVVKGSMDPSTLERVLRAALERNTLDALTDLLRDPLTGFYSREAFITIGERKMESARRTGGTLVLACLLLENLANLRQQFGEPVAESALLDLSELLRASFRKSDVLARIGPAQFAALAVDAAEPSAAILSQRIHRHLMACNTSRHPRHAIEIRLSVGFWHTEAARSFPQLLDSLESSLRGTPVAAGRSDP
jgi:diguanylate cyclase (GGDEF)-like protein